jgi:stearoyl-CoA desaturase (delta-9 desaturase)
MHGTWIDISSVLIQAIIVAGFTLIGYHRLFSHNSIAVNKFWFKVIGIVSVFGGIGEPIAWSVLHRHHHKFSDTEKDIHSPLRPYGSVWHAMFSYNFKSLNWFIPKGIQSFHRDMQTNKTLRFLNSNYFLIWILTGAVVSSLISPWFFLLHFVFVAFLVKMDISFWVNVMGHKPWLFGYKNFNQETHIYNRCGILATHFGEEFHNNHHAHPEWGNYAASTAEFDSGWWIAKNIFGAKETCPHEIAQKT